MCVFATDPDDQVTASSGEAESKGTGGTDTLTIRELLQDLESNHSGERLAAFDKLTSTMDEQTVSLLVSDLQNACDKDVDGAGVMLKARLLALSGDVRAVPVLLHLVMHSGDHGTRYAALWGLGRLGDPTALPGLETAYEAFIKTESFRGESRWILEAIGAIGTARASRFLRKRLIDDQKQVSEDVAWSLGQIQLFSVAKAFERAINDPTIHGKEDLARGIARLGGHESLRVLSQLLEAESPNVRAQAASYLAYTRAETWGWTLIKVRNDGASLPYLLAALEDEHEHVRASAAEAIGRMGDSSAFGVLVRGLADESEAVTIECIRALGRLTDGRIAPLLTRWATAHGKLELEVMVQVARSLGQLRDARAVPLLTSYADHSSSELRSAVTESLLLIGGDATVPPLIDLAQDSKSTNRRMAILALGLVGNVEARTALESLDVAHEDPRTSSIRKAALWMCAGPHDHESLAEGLSDSREFRRFGAALLLLHRPSLANLRRIKAVLKEFDDPFVKGYLTDVIQKYEFREGLPEAGEE
jgi:HEAT repeat protein